MQNPHADLKFPKKNHSFAHFFHHAQNSFFIDNVVTPETVYWLCPVQEKNIRCDKQQQNLSSYLIVFVQKNVFILEANKAQAQSI